MPCKSAWDSSATVVICVPKVSRTHLTVDISIQNVNATLADMLPYQCSNFIRAQWCTLDLHSFKNGCPRKQESEDNLEQRHMEDNMKVTLK